MADSADIDDTEVRLYLSEESRKILTELTGNALGLFRARGPHRTGTLIASAEAEVGELDRTNVMTAEVSSFWFERFLSPRSEQMHHSYYHLLEATENAAGALLLWPGVWLTCSPRPRWTARTSLVTCAGPSLRQRLAWPRR